MDSKLRRRPDKKGKKIFATGNARGREAHGAAANYYHDAPAKCIAV